jgi:hypothetical protein
MQCRLCHTKTAPVYNIYKNVAASLRTIGIVPSPTPFLPTFLPRQVQAFARCAVSVVIGRGPLSVLYHSSRYLSISVYVQHAIDA